MSSRRCAPMPHPGGDAAKPPRPDDLPPRRRDTAARKGAARCAGNARAVAGDAHTTGIYIGSNTPMSIVVKNNHIAWNVIGIFKAGPHVTVVRSGNTYSHVQHRFVSIGSFA